MLHDELRNVCLSMGHQLGLTRQISSALSPFVRLVHDQTFEYDALRQINFNDGYCYDVAYRTKRRIRPSDGATLFIDYAYPEYDKEKSTVLDSFLTEVFPDQDVRDYLVSELAKCLHMQQISPKVLLLYGHGGGGKGMTCRLAVEAFGKKSTPIPHPESSS